MIFKRAMIANIPRFVVNLRDEDIAEMKAVHGKDFTRGLRLAMSGEMGYQVWEGWSNAGKPEAIFGISGATEFGHQIFMVGSESLIRRTKYFLRMSTQIIAHWSKLTRDTGGLYCWVDLRNVSHLRYLRHLGFVENETDPEFGAQKLPFQRMTHV